MKKSRNRRLCIGAVLHNYDPEHEGMSVSITRLAENIGDKVDLHLIVGISSSEKIEFLQTTVNTKKKGNYLIHEVKVSLDENTSNYSWGLENLHFALEQLHKEYKFDVLHAYYANPAGYIATLVGKKNNIPVVVGVRGNDITRDIFVPAKFGWTKWTLDNADYLTFLNQELLELAATISPIYKKAKVVTNSSFYPYPVVGNPKKKPFSMVYVGDVKRKKGFIYLLESLKQVSPAIKLRVIGKVYSSEEKIYSDYIHKNKLENRVEFIGEKDRATLGKYYKESSCLVLPTIADGCPNVLFEAMQLKVPIISTNIPAISQLLRDKKDALLVKPRDSKSLSVAIKYAFRFPAKMSKMADSAFRHLNKFKVEDECKEYLYIYHKLAG